MVIVNPITTAVAAMLLLMEGVRLADHAFVDCGSLAGRWVARLSGSGVRAYSAATAQVYAVREEHGITIIDPATESWDSLARLFTHRPEDMMEVKVTADWRDRGFWRPTRAVRALHLEMRDFGGDFTPDEVAEARRAAATRLGGPHGAALAKQDVVKHEILWRGIAGNLYALSLLGLFAWSLAWVPRVPGWVRARREARARRRGTCARCGYDISNLEGDICPECGAPIKSAATIAE